MKFFIFTRTFIFTILLTCLVQTSLSEACEYAEEYRLIPLGVQPGVLIYGDLNFYRSSDQNLENRKWSGSARLVKKSFGQYTKDTTEVLMTLEGLTFPEGDYQGGVETVLDKFLSHAAKLDGFKRLETVIVTDCHYQNQWGQFKVNLSNDGLLFLEFMAEEKDKEVKSYPVDYPETMLLNIQKEYDFKDLEASRRYLQKKLLESRTEKLAIKNNKKLKDFLRFEFTYRLESYQTYTLGTTRFYVVRLSRGDFGWVSTPEELSELVGEPEVLSLVQPRVFISMPLHHGQSFEVIISGHSK